MLGMNHAGEGWPCDSYENEIKRRVYWVLTFPNCHFYTGGVNSNSPLFKIT